MDSFDGVKANLAKNVRIARAVADLTQEQLANKADVERAQISQIERKVANPSLKTLVQVASALGLPLDRLFADAPASPLNSKSQGQSREQRDNPPYYSASGGDIQHDPSGHR